MSHLFQELRFALRSLRKSPVFTAVAVVTLALGIGANTAIFSVVNAVLLQPLPYPDSDRLVTVWGELRNRDVLDFPASPPAIERYRREASQFEGFGGVLTFDVGLEASDGRADDITAALVSWNLPALLGLPVERGRSFEPRDAAFSPDDVPEEATFPQNTFNPSNAAILSHGLWQRRFGGDPDVVGRMVEIAGNPTTVVGVMSPGTRLLLPPESNTAENPDVWLAMRVDLENAPLENVFLNVIGRMKPGVSIEQAQAEMDQVTRRMQSENSILEASNFHNRLEPLYSDLTDDMRPAVLTLFGAVAFVLLIACANVAGLLLVRAAGRSRETAIKTAIGCSRIRLIALMLLEAGVLALLGGVVGIGLAHLGLTTLVALIPEQLPRLEMARIDGLVLAFTLGAAFLATLLAGVYPAFQSSQVNLADRLNERGRAGAPGIRRNFRNALVVAEVALSFILLIGAGLMVRSFIELQRADPGFDPEGVLTINLDYPPEQFPVPESFPPFQREFQARLEALPGVEAAGGVLPLPFSGQQFASRYATDEATFLSDAVRHADYRNVVPGYFEAMRTTLLSGRTFTRDDQDNARPVAVVNEILARQAWPGEDPIGKPLFIRLATTDPVRVEVIGVVEHQKQVSLAEKGREMVFMPNSFAAGGATNWTVRTSGNPAELAEQVRALVREMNPEVRVNDVVPMRELVRESMAETRFALTLIGVFAIVAMALAAIGLYGLLAYVVRQRAPEIGVRMSFGARPARIFGLVISQGLMLAGAGVAIGVLGAILLTRIMTSLLVNVTPTDPVTYLGIVVVFGAVALVACTLPAMRATRVDPCEALRQE